MAGATASFRDPSGFVAEVDGVFLRVVQPSYQGHYRQLVDSGLYRALRDRGLLIAHEEVAEHSFAGAFKVLKPEQVAFISYPYEWSSSQLKDAALATLEIQETAVKYGMTLKDASAFNMQWVEGRPTLIDTLSFETLQPRPWVAYAQFCRHFLAPLALMARSDPRLLGLMRVHLDGIPLDLARRLLPWSSRFSFWLFVHLHLHASSNRRFERQKLQSKAQTYSLNSLRGLVQSLRSAVESQRWEPAKHAWGNYYESLVTGGGYVEHKKRVVAEYLAAARPRSVWDLGSNTGLFSRIASNHAGLTLSFDGDPDCVEINYLQMRKQGEKQVLPLLMDLTNPTPGLGWEHRERMAWLERPKPDLVLALAIVHHLAIGNNLPLPRIAEFFNRLSEWLVIEFVPKDDANAQKLLQVREDIFSDYNQEAFEAHFGQWYQIQQKQTLENSNRVLYLMRRRGR